MSRALPMVDRSLGALAFALAWMMAARAGAAPARLPEHHDLGEVRIRYAREGADAVDPTDADGDGIPDQVEDGALQAWAALRLFCGVLGYPDPLRSPRYPGVTVIEGVIRNREALGGANGVAYDESQRAAAPAGAGARALVFAFGNHIRPSRNGTPAHEVFHLVQYGMTHFKNGWFLEGMARWSEAGLGRGRFGGVRSGDGDAREVGSIGRVAGMRYEAAIEFWGPLAARDDRVGRLPDGASLEEIAGLRYADGTPVLADREFGGWALMREILLELGRIEGSVAAELGYVDWSEANQRGSGNDIPLHRCALRVAARRVAVGE